MSMSHHTNVRDHSEQDTAVIEHLSPCIFILEDDLPSRVLVTWIASLSLDISILLDC